MAKLFSAAKIRWLKSLVFVICLTPYLALAYDVLSGSISGDPVELMTEITGQWGLRFLLITLSITPLRQLFILPDLIKFRRMFGLFTFFYALNHLIVYLIFEQFFDFSEIFRDIVERKYIFIGMLAFILMIPLAITSTNAMIKRLGGKRWQRLHRLVYVIAISVVTHFTWQVKADITEPVIYALILSILLGYRIINNKRKRSGSVRSASRF